MRKRAAEKVRAPSIVVKVRTGCCAKAALTAAPRRNPNLGGIRGQKQLGNGRRRRLQNVVPPLAAVSQAAKACRKVGTHGLVVFARMLQETAGIAAQRALAALRHTLLIKAVEELACVPLFAAIVEPVPTNHFLVDSLEGEALGRIFLDGLLIQQSFEFKASGLVHLWRQRGPFSAFATRHKAWNTMQCDRRW